MFLVDIAVPRDIHPDVGNLGDVYLYTIDDLQKVVDENLTRRGEAAKAATGDVSEAVAEFMRWLNSARAAVYLQNLHKHARMNSEELVEKALRKIKAGKTLNRSLPNLQIPWPSEYYIFQVPVYARQRKSRMMNS